MTGTSRMTSQEYRWLRILILSIIPMLVLLTIFWGILAYSIPPIDGSISAQDLAQHFRDHAVRLRLGYGVAVPAWGFSMLWSIGVYHIMRRVEGGQGILSTVALIGGGLSVVPTSIASCLWVAAAYRPETDPAIVQMLYDTGWLTIGLFFSVTTFQCVAVGIVFLQDKRAVPLVPKWVAWLGIWAGLEFLVEIIMPQFRSGPFSWAGLFNYWLPFFVPFTWMTALSFYLYHATRRLEAEDTARTAGQGQAA